MSRLIQIESSHGIFDVDPRGFPVGFAHGSWSRAEGDEDVLFLRTIERFDLVEWCNYYVSCRVLHIDILDVGYWYRKDGVLRYETPEPDYRRDVGSMGLESAHG